MQDTYTYYSAFKRHPAEDVDVGGLADEFEGLAARHGVSIRGVYASLGFRTDSDLAMWWVADSADAIQTMVADLERSSLGPLLSQSWAFLGVHRPPEVAKDHVPAFMTGEPPKKYVVIYPFVRTSEWYLMPKEERGRLLHDCMRRLRDAEARRYTKDDTPFITGIRGETKDVFSLLW